jgi:PAS domain S-box-containing protein
MVREPAGSDDLFRTVFETVPTGIVLIDPGIGKILDANPAARGLIGRSREEMTRHDFNEFVSPAQHGRISSQDRFGIERTAESTLLGTKGERTPVILASSHTLSGGRAILVMSIMDLSDRINEKAILLREIHHRVKNNMQLITGILLLEGEKIRDPSIQILFENSKNRIRALAAVHEIAYRSSDFAHIPVETLIATITSGILSSLSGGHGAISLDIQTGTATLDLDVAVPFGILVNELVSNSAIHAFPGGRKGLIEIRYRAGRAACILEYRDDGVGFPPGIDFESPKTTGLELIRSLTGEMNGMVELLGGPGTRYRFTFPGQELVGGSP